MFQRLIFTTAVIVALGWAVSFAQPPVGNAGPQPKAEAKADSLPLLKGAKGEGPVFDLRLSDDTAMKVIFLDPAVTLVTKYGKLSIPATEVRRLEFGFRYPEGVESKIDKGLTDLGSPEFRTREEAEQRLADIGHFAIPALRRAVKGEDPEVVRRAQAVLKLLERKLGDGKPELRDYDVVETAEFTVKGRLELTAIKVRTKFFGEATVKLTDIRSFRSVGSAANAEFALDAAKYAKMNQADWMETSIEVNSGQQLEVAASGQIDQWPQGPGQYMTGPEGQGGPVRRGGVPGVGSGQVVGKIGANGMPFVIGASYKGKMTDNGKLYLRIGPSPWDCDSSGSYKIVANVTNQ